MPLDGTIGYSDYTKTKERIFGEIFTQHISTVCNAIYRKNPQWIKPYLYIDATAGCGVYGDNKEIEGSPLVFYNTWKKICPDIHANCVLIEKDPKTLTELKTNFVGVGGNIKVRFVLGEYIEYIPDILFRLDHWLGLILFDGNNISETNLDYIKNICDNKSMKGMDILINYPATVLKRKSKAFDTGEELSDIFSINKTHWQIRDPIGKYQWTMLYGSNRDCMKLSKTIGFHDIGSPEGLRAFNICNYTKNEQHFHLPNQSKLFDSNKSCSFINIEVKTKKCNVCGEVKSLNDFYSRGYGNKPDGERRVCYCCKVCKDKKRNEWFQRNKERVMKRQRERYIKDYEKNKEKYAVACRRYYLKNKDKILKRHRDNYRSSLEV